MKKNLLMLASVLFAALLTGCSNREQVSKAQVDSRVAQAVDFEGPEPPSKWEGSKFRVGDRTVELGQYTRTDMCGTAWDYWGHKVIVTDKHGDSSDFSSKMPRNTRLRKCLVEGSVMYFSAEQSFLNGGDGELSSSEGKMYRLDVGKKKLVVSEAVMPKPVFTAKTTQGLIVACDYSPELIVLDSQTMKLKERIPVKLPEKLSRLGEPYLDNAKLLPGNKIKLVGFVNVPENMDPENYPYGDWAITYNLDTHRFGRIFLPPKSEKA